MQPKKKKKMEIVLFFLIVCMHIRIHVLYDRVDFETSSPMAYGWMSSKSSYDKNIDTVYASVIKNYRVGLNNR